MEPGGPLFVENVGQFPPHVRYVLMGGPAPVWITDDAVWIASIEEGPRDEDPGRRSTPH